MKISVKEAKAIALIQSKLPFNEEGELFAVLNFLEDKDICKSEEAKRYKEALEETAKEGEKEIACAICGRIMDEDDNLICKKCHEEILSIKEEGENKKSITEEAPREVASEKEETSEKDENSPKREKIRFSKKAIMIVAGSILLAILIAISIILISHNTGYKKIARAFSKNIKEFDYILQGAETEDEDYKGYRISPSGDELYIFTDGHKFAGASLNLMGNDSISRERQALLISCLLMSVYKDIDYDSALELTGKISEQGGIMNFDGYESLLVLDEERSLYFIVNEEMMNEDMLSMLNMAESENSMNSETDYLGNSRLTDAADENDTSVTNIESADGLEMITVLGTPFESFEETFGPSETLLSDTTRYYSQIGVSVMYDEESGNIIYIDIDGNGENSSPLLVGIAPGMERDSVESLLLSEGITLDMADEEDGYAYISYEGLNLELQVCFQSDKVILVCMSVKE